jgi:hypothetical protein
MEPTNYRLNVTLGVNTINLLAYHRKNNFTRAATTFAGVSTSVLATQVSETLCFGVLFFILINIIVIIIILLSALVLYGIRAGSK